MRHPLPLIRGEQLLCIVQCVHVVRVCHDSCSVVTEEPVRLRVRLAIQSLVIDCGCCRMTYAALAKIICLSASNCVALCRSIVRVYSVCCISLGSCWCGDSC